jgi:hypothetical protein
MKRTRKIPAYKRRRLERERHALLRMHAERYVSFVLSTATGAGSAGGLFADALNPAPAPQVH